MIYLETGGININANGEMNFAGAVGARYAGMAIFVARNNTSSITLQGGPAINNSGTIYSPASKIIAAGNPPVTATQIIADSLDIQGTGTVRMDYDGRNPVQGHQVWLVR